VKLLEIQSSPKGDSSDSIALTTSFIEACKSANASIVVDALNVWHEGLPEFMLKAVLSGRGDEIVDLARVNLLR
jgi:FMN-dependent NADH-azoreductase